MGQNKRKTMKKLLLILLCVPLIGLGQCISGDCVKGYGTFKWSVGEYVGNWKDGKMHGQGTYLFINGSKYVGEWKEDHMNGQEKDD